MAMRRESSLPFGLAVVAKLWSRRLCDGAFATIMRYTVYP